MYSKTEERDGLIDLYLNNKLGAVERAAFEIMMLEDAQLFARVQLLEAFKRSLAEESSSLTGKRELFALPFKAWLQQPLSLAASVLVAGLGLQVVYEEATGTDAVPQGVGIGSVFVVEAVRGAQALSLTGAPPYLFQIDAGPGAAGALFSVSVQAGNGLDVISMQGLQSDSEGWVRLVLNQPLDGAYTVKLSRLDTPAQTQSFAVEVSD